MIYVCVLIVLVSHFNMRAMELLRSRIMPRAEQPLTVPFDPVTIWFTTANECVRIDPERFKKLCGVMGKLKRQPKKSNFCMPHILPQDFNLLCQLLDGSHKEELEADQLKKVIKTAEYFEAQDCLPQLIKARFQQSLSAIESGSYIVGDSTDNLGKYLVRKALDQKFACQPGFFDLITSDDGVDQKLDYVTKVALSKTGQVVLDGSYQGWRGQSFVYQVNANGKPERKDIHGRATLGTIDPVTGDVYYLPRSSDKDAIMRWSPTQIEKIIKLLDYCSYRSMTMSPDGSKFVLSNNSVGCDWIAIIDKKSKKAICIDEKNGLPKDWSLQRAFLNKSNTHLMLTYLCGNQLVCKISGLEKAYNDTEKSSISAVILEKVSNQDSSFASVNEDGSLMASFNKNTHTITISELQTGKKIEVAAEKFFEDNRRYPLHVCDLRFIQNGRYLVAKNNNDKILSGNGTFNHTIWRLSKGDAGLSAEKWGAEELPKSSQLLAEISDNGEFAAYQDLSDNRLNLFHINTLRSIFIAPTLPVIEGYVSIKPFCVAFHPDKDLLVVANGYGQLQMVNFSRWADYLAKTNGVSIEKEQKVFREMMKSLRDVAVSGGFASFSIWQLLNELKKLNPSADADGNNNNNNG